MKRFLLLFFIVSCATVSVDRLASGTTLRGPVQTVLSSDDEWESFWASLNTQGAIPDVDFDYYQVIAVVGDVRISKIVENKEVRKVRLVKQSNQTFDVIRIERSAKEVLFN